MFNLRGPLVLRCRSIMVIPNRTVFVMSYEKRKSRSKKVEKKVSKLEKWAAADDKRKLLAEQREHTRKMNELKLLTSSVAAFVRRKEAEDLEKKQAIQVEASTENTERDVEKVYQALEEPIMESSNPKRALFDATSSSLVTSAVPLPKTVTDKLGLAVKYLVSKQHQNWALVLHQLTEAGGLEGISEKDIRKLVYAIPKNQLKTVWPQIETLLDQAGVQKSPKILNALLKSLMAGGSINDETFNQIQDVVAIIKQSNRKGKLSRETYELLLEAHGKRNDLAKVNELIEEMKLANIVLAPVVYSNLLATCVYKARDHKQAVQLFDSMKFLLGKTNPTQREYQDIIVSYINANDVERALDLYQEMLGYRIEANQSIMVALARGCTSREPLKHKAWDFIFDIYRNKWEPVVETLEYMLYLAAKDGDVALSRALYQQLNLSDATTPRSFSFLLLSYAKFSLKSPGDPPAITFNETGRVFRRNILRIDLSPKMDNPRQAVPFLPVSELSSAEVLAESSAVMAHALMVHPGHVNTESANTFLNIAAHSGSMDDFADRFDSFTHLDRSGIAETRTVIETSEESLTKEVGMERVNSYTKSPIMNEILKNANASVPRDTVTYIIALRAAARHKNYAFAQSVWTERGTYRKTSHFKSLQRSEKDRLDFEFATTMVNALTEMKLLEDALAILVSTEYQFKWTWKQLRHLHAASVEVGSDHITRTVRGIVKRAQINYEGKIRRKDYKRYVMERGY